MAYQPKSYRKFVATAATATPVASAIAPVAGASSNFTDVAPKYKEAVDYLVANNITKGATATTFGTHEDIKRGDLAIWLAAALKLDTTGAAASGFEDTKGTRYDAAVSVLKAKGYINGKTATEFAPSAPVTRGEMAIMLSNAYDLKSDVATKFTDAVGNYKTAIQGLYAYGVTTGASDTTFGTNANIKRGDLAIFLKRAAEVVKTPEVVSVSAANAKELVIKFNQGIKKSSVIETSGTNAGTLVDGAFKFDGALGDALKASLSADGKELTVTSASGSTWEGTHSAELISNKAESLKGQKLGQFATAFTFSDDVRASVAGTEYISKYSYKINFSESVQSTGTVSAKYADGSAVTLSSQTLAADGKSLTVVFDSATTVENKEITVSFPALTDYAGNVSIPLTAKVTVSNADQVKPAVVSVTPTSFTTLQVKFSEAVTLLDATKVTFNGTALSSATVAVDANDDTVLNVTVPKTTTSGVLAFGAGAVEDLNTNDNAAYSQTVNFAIDKVAPLVSSTEVVKDASGLNELRVTFSEDVALNGGNLTLKYTDEYGVQRTETIPAAKVSLKSDDDKVVIIDLHNGVSAVKEGVNYTVDLAKGFVEDKFENDSVAKTVSFLNNASATSSKLGLVDIKRTDAVGGTATRSNSGAFLDVQFNSAVDATTATNAANYTVEGAEVEKAVLVYNNPTTANNGAHAVVRVYIKDNTVDASGNYNVTVKGVKGYSSAVTEMNSTTKNIQIVENVRPTVVSSAVKAFNAGAGTTTVTVNFSEAISTDATSNGDFELYVDGTKVSTATVTNGALGSSIDFTIAENLSDELAAGKAVKLVATSTLDLADANGNVAQVTEVLVK